MEIYNDTWTVYVHIFPNGKYYVGITSTIPEQRWGPFGKRYEGQRVYAAIQEYGWNNIEHIIIASSLTKEEAYNMEQILVKELHSKIDENGYNILDGGQGATQYDYKR